MSAPALRLDKKISSLTYWEKHWRLSGITILNNWWQDDTNPAHLETQKSPTSRHHHHLVHIIAEQFITQRHIRYCHRLIFFFPSLVNYTVHHIGWEKYIYILWIYFSLFKSSHKYFAFRLSFLFHFHSKKMALFFACVWFCRIMTSILSSMHQASLIAPNIIVTTGCSSSHLPLAGPLSTFCLTRAPLHSCTLTHNRHAHFLFLPNAHFSWPALALHLLLTGPHFSPSSLVLLWESTSTNHSILQWISAWSAL